MSLALAPTEVARWGAGFLLVVLGLAVLGLRPRRRGNVALAAVCLGAGMDAASQLLTTNDPLWRATQVIRLTALAVEGAGFVALALVFPRPLRGPERRMLLLPAAVALGYLVVTLVALPWEALVRLSSATQDPALFAATLEARRIAFVPLCFLMVLLALRYAAAATTDRERRQLTLVAAATGLPFAMTAGINLGLLPGGTLFFFSAVNLPWVLLVSGLWLANTRLPDRAARRWSRDLALFTLAVPVAVFAIVTFLGRGGGIGNVLFGLGSAFAVLLLVFAILRHQLLGLDVKAKWTLKQSTVAAAFIGVFFVVSESASTFFAASGLGPYLGIAAAGMLVFAIAPLQRAAERVASAAMPGVKAPGELQATERLELYREQLRVAWSDGSLSQDERRLLAATRAKLGISAEDALRLESEVGR